MVVVLSLQPLRLWVAVVFRREETMDDIIFIVNTQSGSKQGDYVIIHTDDVVLFRVVVQVSVVD